MDIAVFHSGYRRVPQWISPCSTVDIAVFHNRYLTSFAAASALSTAEDVAERTAILTCIAVYGPPSL